MSKQKEVPLNGKYLISLGLADKAEDVFCYRQLDQFLAKVQQAGTPSLCNVLNRRRTKGSDAYLDIVANFPVLSHEMVHDIWTESLEHPTCCITPFREIAA